jgi:hypothetical protein
LGVYRVEETTKEKFVANVVEVEMPSRHFYTLRHASKATNVVATYRAKHGIVDNDMV